MYKVGDRTLPFGLQWVGGSDWVILHRYTGSTTCTGGGRTLPFGFQWVGGSDWVILHRYAESTTCTGWVSALPFGLHWVGGSDWVILHRYREPDMYTVGQCPTLWPPVCSRGKLGHPPQVQEAPYVRGRGESCTLRHSVSRGSDLVILHRYREHHLYRVGQCPTLRPPVSRGSDWVILHRYREHHLYRVGQCPTLRPPVSRGSDLVILHSCKSLPFGLQWVEASDRAILYR
jgi:hypothetical protein